MTINPSVDEGSLRSFVFTVIWCTYDESQEFFFFTSGDYIIDCDVDATVNFDQAVISGGSEPPMMGERTNATDAGLAISSRCHYHEICVMFHCLKAEKIPLIFF